MHVDIKHMHKSRRCTHHVSFFLRACFSRSCPSGSDVLVCVIFRSLSFVSPGNHCTSLRERGVAGLPHSILLYCVCVRESVCGVDVCCRLAFSSLFHTSTHANTRERERERDGDGSREKTHRYTCARRTNKKTGREASVRANENEETEKGETTETSQSISHTGGGRGNKLAREREKDRAAEKGRSTK